MKILTASVDAGNSAGDDAQSILAFSQSDLALMVESMREVGVLPSFRGGRRTYSIEIQLSCAMRERSDAFKPPLISRSQR